MTTDRATDWLLLGILSTLTAIYAAATADQIREMDL